MRRITALMCIAVAACGSTANDYNGTDLPDTYESNVLPVATATQSCVSGTWLVRFRPVVCPACVFCGNLPMPPDYTVQVGNTIPFINTTPKLTIDNRKQCVYTSPAALRYTYGDIENGEIRQENFVWNGEIVFSRFTGSIDVGPGFIEEFHNEEIGLAEFGTGNCLMRAIFTKDEQ